MFGVVLLLTCKITKMIVIINLLAEKTSIPPRDRAVSGGGIEV